MTTNAPVSNPSPVWLPEPSEDDPTCRHLNEHTLEWLARSTTPRAIECRRFLNENVARLPAEAHSYFQHALRHRWHSAFFELIVARTLQEMGATLGFEEELSDGKCPDFLATFPDGTVVVEAKAPVVNSDAGEAMKNAQPLLAIIDRYLPKGWHVVAWELPTIGPADSKKEFKERISNLLQVPPPSSSSDTIEIDDEISTGSIRMQLFPSKRNYGTTSGPITTYFDNTEQRIRHAIRSKRRQVRNASLPVLLAVLSGGIGPGDLEDFDYALYGSTTGYVDRNYQETAKAFVLSGEWTKGEPSFKAPTYAGVLAFTEVGFLRCADPVLYWHPRTVATLPEAFHRLEQRYYGIGKVHSQGGLILSYLNFVDPLA